MIGRAPYNSDALQRIRKGASARDLGWDQPFYERVCRAQGIAPVAVAVPATVAIVEKSREPSPAPPAAPRAKRAYSPRGSGLRHPIALTTRVESGVAHRIYNFAAREGVSQLEAMRRLLALGLAQVETPP
jgi:hypothetical protein